MACVQCKVHKTGTYSEEECNDLCMEEGFISTVVELKGKLLYKITVAGFIVKPRYVIMYIVLL